MPFSASVRIRLDHGSIAFFGGEEGDVATAMVLGIGLQGTAVVHDLAQSEGVDEVIAADVDLSWAKTHLSPTIAKKVDFVEIPAGEGALEGLLEQRRPDVVVCMAPPALGMEIARASVGASAHFVSTSCHSDLCELADAASARGLALLPEMGLDPGIDLLLCRRALDMLDEVEGLESYGCGLPAPECAGDNPLNYKVTWTFDGVLSAYLRPARLLRAGKMIEVPGDDMFREDLVHLETVEGIGELEAYPNGDSMIYVEPFELGEGLVDMARYAMRYPGHCAFWYRVAKMGLLDEAPVILSDGRSVSPREVIARRLEPLLQFADGQQDVVVLRVRARGRRDGQRIEVTIDLLDWRDLESGLFAMNRTVGFTASVAAQMLLSGEIENRGLLSPARDVPAEAALAALERRGIRSQLRTTSVSG